MANKEPNDKELNDYLQGNSDLSKVYRASNGAEPPDHLNEKILSAAKEAVASSKKKSKVTFHKSPWVRPVSIAAMITLSVSLVVTMQQETGQPLISEPEIEVFHSATVIEESEKHETRQRNKAASTIGKIEIKQSKDERVNTPVPAALNAADSYRTEEKTIAPKAEMREQPAKKILLKEKIQVEALEERVFADEQVLESAPAKAEFDAVMDMKQDRRFSPEEFNLLEIKTMWEEGELIKAKQAYNAFIREYPDFSPETIKEILGDNIYYALLAQ